MDADLQHPPECLPRIIRAFEEGNEVISMVRTRNKSAGLIKNITSSGFYWLINCISDVHFEPNASDFFAVSRSVAEVLKGNSAKRCVSCGAMSRTWAFRKLLWNMRQA